MFEIEIVATSYDFDGARLAEYTGTVELPAPPTPRLQLYVGKRQVIEIEEVYYDLEEQCYTAYGCWASGLKVDGLSEKGWTCTWQPGE